MMVLSDVGYSATYRQLIGQRQEYEDLMLELFKMYQTESVTAPCDGVVSGIDKNSVQLLAADGQGFTISFLANSPNGDDETMYANYVAKVVAVGENAWALMVNPQPVIIADYTDLSSVPMEEDAMTWVCTYAPQTEMQPEEPAPEEDQRPALTAEMPSQRPSEQPNVPQFSIDPVYELVDGTWKQISYTSISVGDVLLFAADQDGDFVWLVRVKKGTTTMPSTPGDTGSSYPSGGNTGSFPIGGTSSYPSGGITGGYPSSGATQEPAFELYGLDMAQIAAVTPQDTMTLDITVDELDIKALQVGMTAQVKIDALGGEKYTATITEIGNTGTNNGGNSKYTVELTMDRTENILSGMNATATIVLSATEDVLTIPADALVEQGNQTIVYTAYDEETETLLNPVTVRIGNSDGENVEILEGLVNGQTYYYAYYDTLEISFTPDFGGGGFMFG